MEVQSLSRAGLQGHVLLRRERNGISLHSAMLAEMENRISGLCACCFILRSQRRR
jgi:hypothetical protein